MNKSSFARSLRKNQTDVEKLLWSKLRSKQIEGLKFRRQQPIGNYIVDFVCFGKKIIIEADGSHHELIRNSDVNRDNWLISQGFTVLRFWDNEILNNIDGVLTVILHNIHEAPSPNPSH